MFRNLVAFLLPALRRVLCSGSRKTSGPNSCESGYVLLLVFVLILAPASVFAQDNEPTQESRAVQEKKEDPPAPKSENEKAESKATVDPSAMADASAKKNSNSSKDWPLFRGDAKSTGVADTKLPEKLEVLWKYEVKRGAFESSPIIVGGKEKTVYIGDLDGRMFALDLKTGKLKWEFKTVSVRESEAKGKSSGGIGFETAPAYKNKHLYIGDLDGYFYCVDMKGEEVWQYQSDGVIHSSANFHKDTVLFGSEDTRLYALDAKTGKKKWELETADQVRCSVTVVDGRAFVAGCDGALHTINLEKGEEESNVVIESPTGVTPAVVGDVAFVGTEQAGFFALDWKKAEIKWHFNPDRGLASRSSPAVNKDHVIFGSRQREVFSVNPKTGKQNWSRTLKANVDSSPVIVGDRVFIGSTEGRLYALNLKNGETLWQKQLNGGIIGSPAVAFERLIIATDRGVVYCLGKK